MESRQLDDPDISAQHGRQSADSRRLRGSALTRDEQPADGRLYCNEAERELHVALSDNGAEGVVDRCYQIHKFAPSLYGL